MNFSDQSETEDRLKEALQDAKEQYESTKKQFELAMKSTTERGLERVDGNPSVKHIEQAHRDAMQKYRLALVEFNRFIFDNVITPDSILRRKSKLPKPDGDGLK